MKSRSAKLSLVFTAFMAIASAANATTYTLTDLGANTKAYGINDGGVVCGLQIVSGGNEPVYWSSGVMHSVPVPAGNTGVAMSINVHNVMVGTYIGSTYPSDFPYTYTAGGTSVTTISIPAAAFGYGINDSGTVCLWSAQQHVYVTGLGLIYAPNPSGIQTWLLLDPNGTGDSGNCINGSGQFTGYVVNTVPGYGSTNGFFISSSTLASGNGVMSSSGTAINSLGHCCIEYGGYTELYNGSTYTTIGSTSIAATAHGINDSDQVVGSYNGAASVWSSAGGVVNLNSVTTSLPTGWNLIMARAINNSGYIVGYANVTTTGGMGPVTVSHGFLLTPH